MMIEALFRGEVIELACMAHARRKFFDLHQANGSPVAAEALRRIGELYAIEDAAKGKTVEERARRRKETSQLLLEALHLWPQNTRRSVADGGALAKAIDYSLRRWPAFARSATNGFYPIDNNPVENAIRPIAIGKKNWLFAGSEAAGQRAAAIQSLLETARANGIEPMAWLTDTLAKLPDWPNSRIDELLPLKKPV
jgi:transposase